MAAILDSLEEHPRFGQRMLSHVIDARAERNHERPFALITVSSNIEDGFRPVSYRMFANAINRCAMWIEENVGTTTTFDVIAYTGTNDLRYHIVAVAAAKTGHVVGRKFVLWRLVASLTFSVVPPIPAQPCRRSRICNWRN